MPDPKLKAALACALAGCLTAGAVSAVYTAEAKTANTLAMDTVDISAVGEAEREAIPLFNTGSETCATTIQNHGAACWVRIRIESDDSKGVVRTVGAFSNEAMTPDGDSPQTNREASDDTIVPTDNDSASGADMSTGSTSDAWIAHADGYYYLTTVLEEGASAIFSETVSVSENASYEDSETTVEHVVFVEAIQASAFDPDFESDRPWGDVEPEAGIYHRAEGGANEN